jgi:small subunit ribosomal protein S5
MTEENKTSAAPAGNFPPRRDFGPRKFGAEERPRGPKREGGGGGKGRQGGGGRFEKPKAEFEQKMIDIRRVTRVVSGGRRFSYSVATVAGDRKGHVGFGIGKSVDTSTAMDKAYRVAMKKMITLRLNKKFSIPHETSAKFNASKITLMPNKGRGLIAGSSARTILALAGVKDITAKYHSPTKNKLNNAKVVMEALKAFSIPFERSHKPKEERTEGVRKFLGNRDRRDGQAGGAGDRNGAGGRPRPNFRKRFTDDKPKGENQIDKISI